MNCVQSCAALIAIAAAILPVAPLRAGPQPMSVVENVDLRKYMGNWYEVARLPNRFQEQCAADVVVTYALRQDGRVDVTNRCRKRDGARVEARGIARRASDSPKEGKLKVRFAPAFLSFLPMVWGNYWIIGLGADYDWAVIGEPSRKYLWILSRTPSLPDVTFQRALEIAKAQGYDVSRVIRTQNTG